MTDAVTPPVIEFSSEARGIYLENLARQMRLLYNHIHKTKTLGPQLINYYGAFADIISVMMHDSGLNRMKPLTVSSFSGMPIYSRIISVLEDRSKQKIKEDASRPNKEIVKDLVSAIYNRDTEGRNVFRREFQKAYYHNQLRNIHKFEDVNAISTENNEDKNIERIRIENGSYPLSEMTCVSLTIEAAAERGIKFSKIKGLNTQNTLSWGMDAIYHYLYKNGLYTGSMMKTTPKFYFKGRCMSDIMKKILDYEKNTFILEFRMDILENIDMMVANSSKDLASSDFKDYKISSKFITVASPELTESLKEHYAGTFYRIVTDER